MFDFQPEHLADLPLPIQLAMFVVGAIIQDDLTCITAGVYAASGALPFWPLTLACLLGTFLGDLAYLLLGRLAVYAAVQLRALRRLIAGAAFERARALLGRHGAYLIIGCRFLPGIRAPVQLATGALYPNLAQACLYLLIACAIYTPLMVGGAATFGSAVDVEQLRTRYGHVSLFATAAVLWLVIALLRFAGRRLFRRAAQPAEASPEGGE